MYTFYGTYKRIPRFDNSLSFVNTLRKDFTTFEDAVCFLQDFVHSVDLMDDVFLESVKIVVEVPF